MFESTRRTVLRTLGLGTAASLAATGTMQASEAAQSTANERQTDTERVAADPTDVPDPITRDEPTHHDVTLTAEERVAEIEDGVSFRFLTFDGQVPGPMLRVRQGDTVSLTLENASDSRLPHNVDLHAVYGTGGGSDATTAAPGEQASVRFKAMYPGAYIYHCAVPNLDYHVSSGMFGLILVEPTDGLPEVDREFYLGQHEVYTDKAVGEEGRHDFSFERMTAEEPTYVLFNGEKYPFTPDRYGTLTAQRGERVRVYLVAGGPNYPSNFHPIGNVWARAWPNGALATDPDEYVQTMTVPPGSCFVGDMETPVPERIKLVDHALTRVARRGLLAEIDVEGEQRRDVFDPSPDGSTGGDQDDSNGDENGGNDEGEDGDDGDGDDDSDDGGDDGNEDGDGDENDDGNGDENEDGEDESGEVPLYLESNTC